MVPFVNGRPPIGIGSPIVATCFRVQDAETVLGSSIAAIDFCRKKHAGKNPGKNGQTGPGANWEFLVYLKWPPNHQVFFSLHKSAGKQSDKGGCPQGALILCNVAVLVSSLVSDFL